MALERTHLKIQGMTCGHCEKFVSNLLKDLNGVSESKVSQPDGSAEIVFDSNVITKQQIIDAVNETGAYKAA